MTVGGPSSLRLFHTGAGDVGDILFGPSQGGTKVARGLVDAIGASTLLELVGRPVGGWAANVEVLTASEPQVPSAAGVLLTSTSAEIADPSPDPADALLRLARLAGDRGLHLIVLNASSVVPATDHNGQAGGEPLSLRIRRLNLVVMETSHATGMSVIDADRLVAETPLPGKVRTPFDYAAPVCEALQSEAVRILSERGLAGEREVMALHVPFVNRATDLSVLRWLKDEGDVVAPDDVVCELRLAGIRRMTRPTDAFALGSISGRRTLAQTIFSRERVLRRNRPATVSVVAGDTAVLRSILTPAGTRVEPDSPLALLSTRTDTVLGGASTAGVFRVVARTDDATSEALL